eukprot:475341_1
MGSDFCTSNQDEFEALQIKQKRKIKKNTKSVKHRATFKIGKRDIEFKAILTVEGYVRRYAVQKIVQLFPQSLIDLIAWIYAKPVILRLKYNEKVKDILYCPV